MKIVETFEGAFAEGVTVTGTLVSNVKLLGSVSRNNRVYSEQALEDAARLYPGALVYLNHDDFDPTNRQVQELAGTVRNPRRVGQEIRGDLQLIDFGEGVVSPATLVKALAEQMPNAVGMSHAAEGELKPVDGDGPDIVESLSAVHSIDIVTNPATTAGFFEQIRESHDDPQGADDMKITELTLEQLRTSRPDLVEKIETSLAESGKLKELQDENAALKTENDALKAKDALREHKALVATKLEKAELPEALVTDQFRESLDNAKDEAAVDALIADRKAIAEHVKPGGPRSHETRLEFDRGGDDKPLAESELAGYAPGGSKSLFS